MAAEQREQGGDSVGPLRARSGPPARHADGASAAGNRF